MTPATIARIRLDFSAIAGDADGFAVLFYDTLFRLDPALRPLFPADLAAQRGKLVQALAFVVGSLDRFGQISGAVADLGVRHRDYGVTASHYGTVGTAILMTLDARLDGLTAESRAAWSAAYAALAEVMIDAAEAVSPLAAE